MGTIPYGYEITDDFSFVIVEDEARIVAEIIANIAAGSTLNAEAKRLNDLGIPSPGHRYRSKPRTYGPSRWHSSVRGIVQQRAYAGTHEVKINGGSERIERKVPAIVEPALQERALLSLAENKRYSGGRGSSATTYFAASCGALSAVRPTSGAAREDTTTTVAPGATIATTGAPTSSPDRTSRPSG